MHPAALAAPWILEWSWRSRQPRPKPLVEFGGAHAPPAAPSLHPRRGECDVGQKRPPIIAAAWRRASARGAIGAPGQGLRAMGNGQDAFRRAGRMPTRPPCSCVIRNGAIVKIEAGMCMVAALLRDAPPPAAPQRLRDRRKPSRMLSPNSMILTAPAMSSTTCTA